jgi:hypothetical protein
LVGNPHPLSPFLSPYSQGQTELDEDCNDGCPVRKQPYNLFDLSTDGVLVVPTQILKLNC